MKYIQINQYLLKYLSVVLPAGFYIYFTAFFFSLFQRPHIYFMLYLFQDDSMSIMDLLRARSWCWWLHQLITKTFRGSCSRIARRPSTSTDSRLRTPVHGELIKYIVVASKWVNVLSASAYCTWNTKQSDHSPHTFLKVRGVIYTVDLLHLCD